MGHGLSSVLCAEWADVTRGIHKTLNRQDTDTQKQLQTDTAQASHSLPALQTND